jgi:hypothetical protein
MEAPMPDFTRDQIDRARHRLAHPDPQQSPALRSLRERIARHVIASAEAAPRGKVVTIPRAVFQAGLRGQRLTAIEGGVQ